MWEWFECVQYGAKWDDKVTYLLGFTGFTNSLFHFFSCFSLSKNVIVYLMKRNLKISNGGCLYTGGNKGCKVVGWSFLITSALIQISCVPILSWMSFIRPCMPPGLSSMILECKSWGDDLPTSETSLMFNITVAIIEGYSYLLIWGTGGLVALILFLYPGEVLQLMIKDMER